MGSKRIYMLVIQIVLGGISWLWDLNRSWPGLFPFLLILFHAIPKRGSIVTVGQRPLSKSNIDAPTDALSQHVYQYGNQLLCDHSQRTGSRHF